MSEAQIELSRPIAQSQRQSQQCHLFSVAVKTLKLSCYKMGQYSLGFRVSRLL